MENFIIIFVFVKAYFLILESLNRSSMLSLSSSIFLAWFVLNKRSKLDVQWSKPTKQLSFYASKCLSAYLGSKILLLILLGSIFFVTFSSLVPLFSILLIVPTTLIEEFVLGWIIGSGLNGIKDSTQWSSSLFFVGVGSLISLLFLRGTEILGSISNLDWIEHEFSDGRTTLFELNDLFPLYFSFWISIHS